MLDLGALGVRQWQSPEGGLTGAASKRYYGQLAVLMTTMAVAVAIVVTIAIPVGYYELARIAEARDTAAAARLHAAFVSQAINDNPSGWATSIGSKIDRGLTPLGQLEHRSIRDLRSHTLASNGVEVMEPSVQAAVPLFGPDGAVGDVLIQRSLHPLVERTALLALLSTMLGLTIYVALRVLPLRNLRRMLASLERKEARAREEIEGNLQLVFQHSLEGIVMLTSSGEILSCNTAAAIMFGRRAEALRGLSLNALLRIEPQPSWVGGQPSAQFETLAYRADGSEFPIEVAISEAPINGSPRRIAIVRDVTERKQAEARLSRMANFDSLTGLPNRALFRERLQQAMDHARASQRRIALMFLDIDRFKTINDSLGHDFGDRLLALAGLRLAQCIRQGDVDMPGRVAPDHHGGFNDVYRLGGDEFTVVLQNLDGVTPVTSVARRILAALSEPFQVGEHEIFISVSIGITLYPDEECDMDGLIRQADLAMYRSKESGRDTYSYYNAELNAIATERHMLETQLRQAHERREFRLVYQPKADLNSRTVYGVEALLRWVRPDGLEIGPEKFVPVLEETGLIVPVGLWVMQEACRQLVAWDRAGMPPLQMSVNLCARQFRQVDLIDRIASTLHRFGLAPSRLEIELTESALFEDSDLVSRIMASLGRLGVAISIDDFGTGHSSLSYLKRFDVDTLKIDRSFVRDTPDDPEDNAIAIAVIALAHGLGLKAVAEGVENEAQERFLREQGCDYMQGFLLSEPLEGDPLQAWLSRRLGLLETGEVSEAAPPRQAVAQRLAATAPE